MGNTIAFLTSLGSCVGCVGFCGALGHFGVVSRVTARKLLHTGTGLVFLTCWPLFDSTAAAHYLCTSVPALATAHFLLVGTGAVKDQLTVASSTRTGDKRELLKGPFLYGLANTMLSAIWWRSSPTGITAISILCAGDGVADLVGRRFGQSNPLPFNKQKSWAGTTACATAGFLAAAAFLLAFQRQGYLLPDVQTAEVLWKALVTSICSSWVEALPIPEIDNLTVALSAALSARLLFGC